MKIYWSKVILACATSIAITVITIGCMAYQIDKPSHDVNAMLEKKNGKLTSVYIDFKYMESRYYQTDYKENSIGRDYLRKFLTNAIVAAQMCDNYTFMESRATNCDYRLEITFKVAERGSIGWGCLSGLTFTILPYTYKTIYTIEAHLYDAKGQMRQTEKVETGMRFWGNVLLLPLGSWKSPEKVERKIIHNTFKDVLRKMVDCECAQRRTEGMGVSVNDADKLAAKSPYSG